jgi:putative membrane protein
MIRDYANHAANERTFLAWVRTSVAVIALGLVIERFNFFLLSIEKTFPGEGPSHAQVEKLSGPLGRYGGLGLVLGGGTLIVISALRFLRTERLLQDEEVHPVGRAHFEFFLLTTMVLCVACFGVYVALD